MVENIDKILKEQCGQYHTWKWKQSDLTASASSQKDPQSALPLPLLHHCWTQSLRFIERSQLTSNVGRKDSLVIRNLRQHLGVLPELPLSLW